MKFCKEMVTPLPTTSGTYDTRARTRYAGRSDGGLQQQSLRVCSYAAHRSVGTFPQPLRMFTGISAAIVV